MKCSVTIVARCKDAIVDTVKQANVPESYLESTLTQVQDALSLTERLNTTSSGAMASDSLSVTFAALADPTRRAILARLAGGEVSVTKLAAPFDMSFPAITKHLKVLERAGLITRGKHAQWRPCKLQAKPLSDVADYVEEYRRYWEHSFDRLDDYLKEIQAREQKHDTNQGEFTFKPLGRDTEVTWAMSGKKNFISKAFCMFMDMDKMVGGDFEKGLASMKKIAEKAK